MSGITYILLARNRPQALMKTLWRLSKLHTRSSTTSSVGALTPVIIIDNASWTPSHAGAIAFPGLDIQSLAVPMNHGPLARNLAAQLAGTRSAWMIMLDDDSAPVDTGFIDRLGRMPDDVAAVSADIWQPGLHRRETGGLPEVFVNCGVAIRATVFNALRGYDQTFGPYAEEYELAARMLLAGYRIAHDPWFRIEHDRTAMPVRSAASLDTAQSGLRFLVRNNGWLMQRFAPASDRRSRLREARSRYRAIAQQFSAQDLANPAIANLSVLSARRKAVGLGFQDFRRTVRLQPRTPMPQVIFDRFTGLAHAREALQQAWSSAAFHTASIVDEGRNAWAIRQALTELGIREIAPSQHPEAFIIGTMAPGPMLDAYERRIAQPAGNTGPSRTIAPWKVVIDRFKPITAEMLVGGYANAGGRRISLESRTPGPQSEPHGVARASA